MANGAIHIGMPAKSPQDFIVKSRSLAVYDSPYSGLGLHGLPIDMPV